MKRRKFLIATGATAIAGCTKSNLTTPSDVRVSFRSMRNDAPVPGIVLSPDFGSVISADDNGIVTIPYDHLSSAYQVSGPALLTHRMYCEDGVEHLFPNDAQMPEWWIRQALYQGSNDQWLWRPDPGLLSVVPSAAIYADSFAMGCLAEGIRMINEACHQVQYRLVPQGESVSGRTVTVRLDRSLQYFAVTLQRVDGPKVIGAEITFKTFRLNGFSPDKQALHASRATAHELAHVSGVSGHPQPIPGVYTSGIMWGNDPRQEFAQPEKDILNWLFYRPAGTRPPDDTTHVPGLGASSSVLGRVAGLLSSKSGGHDARVVCALKNAWPDAETDKLVSAGAIRLR